MTSKSVECEFLGEIRGTLRVWLCSAQLVIYSYRTLALVSFMFIGLGSLHYIPEVPEEYKWRLGLMKSLGYAGLIVKHLTILIVDNPLM